MSTYTFSDALPVRGSESQLVTAAIAAAYPKSLTELARDAGISKFAASRAAEPLTGSGLLSSTADGYVFNDDHPLASVLVCLAWRFSGVRRPPAVHLPGGGDPAVVDYHHQRWIPEPLQVLPADLSPAADVVTAGPDLRSVRETTGWMGELLTRLRGYEEIGQQVYRWWSTERLRDIIHQTLHFGGALGPARASLMRAAGSDAQGSRAPESVTVPALVWVQATYFASAELRDLLRVISILERAVRVGGTVHRWRTDALWHLDQVNRTGRDSEFAEQWLQEGLDAAARAEALWADESHGPYKHIGGLPRPEDVGTAGDKILAVRLHQDATELAARVEQMAAHPSVQEWNVEHPDLAKQVPLVRQVPSTALPDSRALGQMPTPEPGAGPFR